MECSNKDCDNQFSYDYGKIYCSRSCAAKVNNSKRPKRELKQWNCQLCNIEIIRTTWKDRSKLCESCRLIRRKQLAESARKQRSPRVPVVKTSYEFTCQKCGLNFKSNTRTRLYCSKECRKYVPKNREVIDWESFSVKEARGMGNANQRSRMPYIRSLARKKYLKSNKPQKCFICNYEYHFDVCHIKDVHKYGDDTLIREVNHIDNLVALCKNHHWEFDTGKLSINLNGQIIQK